MNKSMYNTFQSPYHVFSLSSNRYRHVMPWFMALLIIIPLLFLFFKSFGVYLTGQVLIFILFPLFIWVELSTDDLTDVKLDIIKIFVTLVLYGTYLAILAWVMVGVFQPELKVEYMLINIGYIFLLLLMGTIVTAVAVYHRYVKDYAQRKKKQNPVYR